ncbi:probable peroxygenase 5 [Elaeis guineensis]|uniref:probable peroxygenase 5 n=1 Tax=Elaeis guineensis var. tenera TaxID=51953 RepID=UPI003C6D6634
MAKLSGASYVLLLLLVIASGCKGQDQNNGTDMTALQKHVSFFDRDKDGVIYPIETFQGFRAIGCSIPLSTVSAPLIHAFLSPKTNNGSIPAIKLPIIVANIAKGKHGSDSGAYDTDGKFVPEKFEEIFQKHAHAHPDALTSDELKEMLKANQQPGDLPGSFASRTEWEILFSLVKDKDGLLQKETLRSVFDGSLFYKLEAENKSPK